MENLIKVPVKPIVKQFLVSRLGDPYPVYMNEAYGLVINSFLTLSFEHRYQHRPDGMVDMHIKVSNAFKNYFLEQQRAEQLSTILEKLFWKDAVNEIINYQHLTRNKSAAMREFYTDHQITEDMYSMDNFQRQLNRLQIRSTSISINPPKPAMFHCVSDADAQAISKMYNREGVSSREIASIFRIDHKSVLNIAKKLKEKNPGLS